MSHNDQKELAECLNLLTQIFGDIAISIEWWNFSHPLLGGSPLMALANGKVKIVIKILEGMKTGQTS